MSFAYCAHAAEDVARPASAQSPSWTLVQTTAAFNKFEAVFDSPEPSGKRSNDLVPIQLFVPKSSSGPVPCVLVLHYWGATDSRVETNMALDLAKRGVASVIMPLPYHLSRTQPGFRSGEEAITPDPEALTKTMGQSIADIKRTIDLVQARDDIRKDRFGITGTSLGSIVAALAVARDERITDAAFVVGGVDLAHILWHSSRVVKERDILRRKGYTEDKLREALSPIEPAQFLPERKLKNSYVVAAKFDTVIPPVDTEKLIQALGSTQILRLDTGHYGGFFVQKRVQASVATFFATVFEDQPFVAPKSIDAPTIRLGVSMADDLQIAVGLDLIRPANTDAIFATALLSTQGGHLFVGRPLDRGLSVGIVVDAKRPKFGLFWSIVL